MNQFPKGDVHIARDGSESKTEARYMVTPESEDAAPIRQVVGEQNLLTVLMEEFGVNFEQATQAARALEGSGNYTIRRR